MNNADLEATIIQLWKDALALQRLPETQVNKQQLRDIITAHNALNELIERVENV
jgi:hypothetical protein